MVRFNRIHFLLLTFAILICGSLAAQAEDIYYIDAAGKGVSGVRCATPIPSLDRTEKIVFESSSTKPHSWTVLENSHIAFKEGHVRPRGCATNSTAPDHYSRNRCYIEL